MLTAERPFISPDTKRDSLFGDVDYDLTDNVNVYVQGIYGRGYTRQINIGGAFNPVSGQVNAPITIYRNNAFLPAALNQLMTTNLIDKDPPITAGYGGLFGTSGQYNSSLFDLLGRRFTVGVRFNY